MEYHHNAVLMTIFMTIGITGETVLRRIVKWNLFAAACNCDPSTGLLSNGLTGLLCFKELIIVLIAETTSFLDCL